MAFIAASVIGGAAALGGGILASNAAGDAAQAQADAANHASQLQYDQYQQQRTDQEPWRQAGVTALSGLQNPDFQKTFSGMGDLSNDPGYQFRMQQGQQALERSAAAGGGLQNGGFMKALNRYGQDYASNEYQNAYNRFNNDQSTRFNRLSSIAGLGQTANNQVGAAGQNYANQVGQNTMGAANVQGAAGIAGANAWGNSLSNIANLGVQGSWMNQWNNAHPKVTAENTLSGGFGM